ncbi:hypothetical protein C8Q78DRAFT_994495 [Trametes maxima]|nr:hypothetical protein C8Q78DRAFT_994495 [Trametes maxima]
MPKARLRCNSAKIEVGSVAARRENEQRGRREGSAGGESKARGKVRRATVAASPLNFGLRLSAIASGTATLQRRSYIRQKGRREFPRLQARPSTISDRRLTWGTLMPADRAALCVPRVLTPALVESLLKPRHRFPGISTRQHSRRPSFTLTGIELNGTPTPSSRRRRLRCIPPTLVDTSGRAALCAPRALTPALVHCCSPLWRVLSSTPPRLSILDADDFALTLHPRRHWPSGGALRTPRAYARTRGLSPGPLASLFRDLPPRHSRRPFSTVAGIEPNGAPTPSPRRAQLGCDPPTLVDTGRQAALSVPRVLSPALVESLLDSPMPGLPALWGTWSSTAPQLSILDADDFTLTLHPRRHQPSGGALRAPRAIVDCLLVPRRPFPGISPPGHSRRLFSTVAGIEVDRAPTASPRQGRLRFDPPGLVDTGPRAALCVPRVLSSTLSPTCADALRGSPRLSIHAGRFLLWRAWTSTPPRLPLVNADDFASTRQPSSTRAVVVEVSPTFGIFPEFDWIRPGHSPINNSRRAALCVPRTLTPALVESLPDPPTPGLPALWGTWRSTPPRLFTLDAVKPRLDPPAPVHTSRRAALCVPRVLTPALVDSLLVPCRGSPGIFPPQHSRQPCFTLGGMDLNGAPTPSPRRGRLHFDLHTLVDTGPRAALCVLLVLPSTVSSSLAVAFPGSPCLNTSLGRSALRRTSSSPAPQLLLLDADDFASTLPPSSTPAVGRRYGWPAYLRRPRRLSPRPAASLSHDFRSPAVTPALLRSVAYRAQRRPDSLSWARTTSLRPARPRRPWRSGGALISSSHGSLRLFFTLAGIELDDAPFVSP